MHAKHVTHLHMLLQVALILSMLPDCARERSAPGQLQESTPEQGQDSITVATVDSYQASSPPLKADHHGHDLPQAVPLCIFSGRQLPALTHSCREKGP